MKKNISPLYLLSFIFLWTFVSLDAFGQKIVSDNHNHSEKHSSSTAMNAPNDSRGRVARGEHVGGIQVTLCDGAVRFISDNIDLGTYRALSTRRGKEVVGEF